MNVNNGVLDGLRRIGGRFRDLAVDGGVPGAPLGFRLRGATASGAPAAGTWKAGDVVPDRNGVIWTCITGGTPGAWRQPAMTLLASAGAGYALANGTGTIVSWTAPSDGQLHRVMVLTTLHVTSTETGGALRVNFTLPDGTSSTATPSAGGSSSGTINLVQTAILIEAGSTVSLTQFSALTAGAATVWAEIWGS